MSDTIPESVLLKGLKEQRLRAVKSAREYAERAVSGDMSADDETGYAKANGDIDKYGKLINDEITRAKEDRDLLDAMRGAPAPARAPEGTPRLSLSDMMRRDLKAAREGAQTSGGCFQPLPAPETRAGPLAEATATKGAELLPTTLVGQLYEKLIQDSAILSADPTILRTQSGEPMKLPRLTALKEAEPTQAHSRVAESGAIFAGDPTFDQVSLDAYKFAQYTQVSRELIEDGVLDVEALIGRVLGRNLANFLGYDLTLGTGVSQPRGVRVIAALNKIDSAGGGLFPTTDFDKFLDVVGLVLPGYRRNAKWVVNDGAMFTLRKIKMNGLYAWEPNAQGAGQPDRFLGYPILADINVPAPGPAAGVSAIFADFSQYFVRMVRDVRVEWSTEYAWVNDLLSVKAVVRADGDAIDDAAFAGFNSTA